MPLVRAATALDLGQLAKLLDNAVAATPEGRGGHLFGRPQREVESTTRLGEALLSDQAIVFVAEQDGVSVGFALVTANERLGTIEELYVDPGAATSGSEAELLQAAVVWCQTQNCGSVDMPALPGDRATKNLCEGAGFKARLLIMHKSL